MSYRKRKVHPGRPRLSKARPRGRYGSYKNPDKDDHLIIIKIIVTIVILLAILIIKSVDRPLPQKMITIVRTAITQDFDIKDSVGKLKFVQKYSPKVKSVFGIEQSQWMEDGNPPADSFHLIMPAEGSIIRDFKTVEGFDIEGEDTMEVIAAADGKILLVDKHDKGYAITIEHSENLVTVYHNITQPYVTKGGEMKQGDIIGKIEGQADRAPLLHFKVWQDERPIDPDSLLR